MTSELQLIIDMGLLSKFSYKYFGVYPILINETFSQFVDGGETYSLNSSYTIVDYVSTYNYMQALLIANDGD